MLQIKMLPQTSGNLGTDRESFERNQTISLQKAINITECATKEKHIRTAILGTYQERGAGMFWHVVNKLPYTTEPIVAWKLCHVFHKVIRDGHPMVLKDSMRHKQQLIEIGRSWNYFSHVYGKLVGAYVKCLTLRLDFHNKYQIFPGNLTISAEDFQTVEQRDINSCFELCVDLLDNLECFINLERKVFATLDSSRAFSVTGPGKCRLTPCILVILDTSQLYDLIVKTLFKLHNCLPSDALSEHRKRFEDIFNGLKNFYNICSNLQYFKKLIQIPDLPDSPPDFLVKSDNNFELGPVHVIEEEEPEREPSPEPVVYDLIDTDPDEDYYANIDPIFLMRDMAPSFQRDSRDDEIEILRAEIARLKSEIEALQAEFNQEIHVLLEEIRLLHRDMHDASASANNASSEAGRLQQLAEAKEATKSQNAIAAQKLVQNVEKKAFDREEMYKKMKDKHMALVKEHADLLRKNVETQRATDAIRKNIGNGENDQLKQEIGNLKKQLETYLLNQKERERRLWEERERLLAVATDQARDVICLAINSLDDVTTRTCSAESLVHIVTQSTGVVERLDGKTDVYKRTGEISDLIQALSLFGHSMAHTIDNGGATCNMAPDGQGQNLKTSCKKCGNIILTFLDNLKQTGSSENVKQGLEEVLRAARPSGLESELRDQHRGLTPHRSARFERVYTFKPFINVSCCNILFRAVSTDLLPKMSDVKGGDLHDLVEQEMASTAKAVEQAAERIEALLNEARKRDSGVNLEVNERILDSCTELMKMIKILIAAATELQREIVAQGKGTSTKKEFYMRNSRWTEGLISAAKAVGWGATMLTDSADVVIQGTGKFEELVVWSHEISASTAQLVAASRVKATNRSTKLTRLETASRNVNGATTKVVSSTKAGRQQLDDARNYLSDVTNIASLTQAKRKEMDSQVKVLALEQALQQERLKLGALRKKHYTLAELKEYNEVPTDKSTKSDKLDANLKSCLSKTSIPAKPAIPIKPIFAKPAIPIKPVFFLKSKAPAKPDLAPKPNLK